MTLLRFRCPPGFEDILPAPRPAAEALPDWLKRMPAQSTSDLLNGDEVRTLKQCPPFIDAMTQGFIIPLACDVEIRDGEISWDWSPPPLGDQLFSRAPIGLHLPEQGAGSDLGLDPDRFVVKFMNFWTIEAPPGWSVLFTHPFNRLELPFTTLTGTVDCDRFCGGLVHFPAVLDPEFEGVIEKGTPVAQAIAVPRSAMEMDIGVMTPREAETLVEVQGALQSDPGVYRKRFRVSRTNS